jgi:hypothetical protein
MNLYHEYKPIGIEISSTASGSVVVGHHVNTVSRIPHLIINHAVLTPTTYKGGKYI